MDICVYLVLAECIWYLNIYASLSFLVWEKKELGRKSKILYALFF